MIVQAPTIGVCFAARPPCYARKSEISYRSKITEDRKTYPEKPAVLFVCLGNICRSPLAEAAFRAEVVRIRLDVEVQLRRHR